jgi:hypothetical protein
MQLARHVLAQLAHQGAAALLDRGAELLGLFAGQGHGARPSKRRAALPRGRSRGGPAHTGLQRGGRWKLALNSSSSSSSRAAGRSEISQL